MNSCRRCGRSLSSKDASSSTCAADTMRSFTLSLGIATAEDGSGNRGGRQSGRLPNCSYRGEPASRLFIRSHRAHLGQNLFLHELSFVILCALQLDGVGPRLRHGGSDVEILEVGEHLPLLAVELPN